jgi:LacI family transcriptional regulator
VNRRVNAARVMPELPRRLSLVAQTAGILKKEIEAGAWPEWLPGERQLCETLQVSRNTLRAALALLKKERLIRAEHGAGNRILPDRPRHAARSRSVDVALLSPEPLEHLRPTQTLWIDDLRGMLSEHGCRLHIFHGRQYFRANPGPALKKLVAHHVHGCWILTLASEGIQTWFNRSGTPCVVAGSVHAGLNLPFRDLDHRALCRHAVGVLLAHGHRSVAMLIAESMLAGDLESEAGFLEAVRRSSSPDVSGVIERHRGGPLEIDRALRRLLARKSAPTAFIVANAYHYLTVASSLAQMNRRVPEQISLISRDEDPFLHFMRPLPAHYVSPPQAFAKALLRPILEILQTGAAAQPALKLTPEFVRGDSVGVPAAATQLQRTGLKSEPLV